MKKKAYLFSFIYWFNKIHQDTFLFMPKMNKRREKLEQNNALLIMEKLQSPRI